jgi:hypothetical protein
MDYTAIGLPFYFAVAKYWYPKLLLPLKGFLHFITLFLVVASLTGNVQIMIPMLFLGTRIYQIGWFDDPYRDSSAFATVFWLPFTLLFALALKLRWKHKWLKYVILVAILYLVLTILQITGIQRSYVWWDKWYGVTITFVLLWVAEAINKRLWNGPPQRKTGL